MSAITAAPRRRSLWRRSTGERTALTYILPAALVMAVITFYPLVFQLWMSFTDYGIQNLRRDGPAPNVVGLDNYIRILQSKLAIPNFHFLRLIAFNLWWALSNTVVHLVLGVLIAVLMNTPGLWFRRVYRAIYILPVIFPIIIVATVWRNVFDTNSGAVNLGLQAIGALFKIPAEAFRIDWLQYPYDLLPGLPLAYFAMLVANTWLGWPLFSVVATGALQSIPRELYEAAQMDGANARQRFINVTIPFLRPAMIPYSVYGFVVTFNLFFLTYFMTGGGPFGKTELLVTQAYGLVRGQQLFGVAAAFSVIMFLILLVITLITNRVARATASYDV
jgi:arabinogalactan oligomer/maltooligosaccharide transport system permease protein